MNSSYGYAGSRARSAGYLGLCFQTFIFGVHEMFNYLSLRQVVVLSETLQSASALARKLDGNGRRTRLSRWFLR